jgi:starvation-inducible DNA-binding protein
MTLIETLNRSLADTFAFYLKAQYYHWNVEGPDFYQYHQMFGTIYDEVYQAIDPIAEHIRAAGGYAAGTFARYIELTDVKEVIAVPSAMEMIADLERANAAVITNLTHSMRAAEDSNDPALANYIQERIDAHKKHGWFLRATQKARISDE